MIEKIYSPSLTQEEQETFFNFDEKSKQWRAFSTIKRDITKIIMALDPNEKITIGQDKDGDFTLIEGVLNSNKYAVRITKKHFRITKKREFTEEQREKLRERLKKGRRHKRLKRNDKLRK